MQEIPSPAVCSMFRTFQGWTALTAQGPGVCQERHLPAAAIAELPRGQKPPDFTADDFEADFVGRATADDLTALGRAQMGFELCSQ